jgi:hypothetical protein
MIPSFGRGTPERSKARGAYLLEAVVEVIEIKTVLRNLPELQ